MPDPGNELIFYIPGHINIVVQHEGEVPKEIFAIFTDIYDIVLALTPSYRTKHSPVPDIQTWDMGYAPHPGAKSDAPTDKYETLLPISMISWNLDNWGALTSFSGEDDNSLGSLTKSLMTIVDDKLARLIANPTPRGIISAHCLPGYAVRPEGYHRPDSLHKSLEIASETSAGKGYLPDEVQHGTGGPAAFPIPYRGLEDRQTLQITVDDRNLCINGKFQNLTGENVCVAVLDTSFQNLEEVQQFAVSIGVNNNWLYDDMLYQKPILFSDQVFIQPQDEKYFMRQSGDDIQWRSHGFNVAGLVRLAAPNATIKLYRVLNDQGIGSLQSILSGLKQALDDLDDGKTKVVINCSFTISQPDASDDEQQRTRWPEDRKFIELLFDAVTRGHPNVTFIASAGNDALPGIEGRPAPCYPAAAAKFAAIAAINFRSSANDPSDVELTYYSNASTAPQDHKIGLAVFGGEAELPPNLEGQETNSIPLVGPRGLVTPHIESFYYTPDHQGNICKIPNTNGFARVAGTSYSAAVASGLCALLLSDSDSNEENNNPIRVLQAAKEDPDCSPDQGVRISQNTLFPTPRS